MPQGEKTVEYPFLKVQNISEPNTGTFTELIEGEIYEIANNLASVKRKYESGEKTIVIYI